MSNLPRVAEKRCSKCEKTKPVDEFHRDKRTPKGHLYKCKSCVNKYSSEWGSANRARKTANNKEWRKRNPDKTKRHTAMGKIWKQNHPTRVRGMNKKSREKRRSTPKGKLNHNIGSLICLSLRGSKAGWHWENIVGYTLEQLIGHLEKHFLPGMSWENYGKVWEIDHKIPVAAFNFEKPEDIDFKRCWALKNLQPLWTIDNRRKQDRVNKPFQPSLALAL